MTINTIPPKIPQVIILMKETYLLWIFLHKNFPKVERLGIGNKIEQAFLLVLEFTFLLSYSPFNQKIILIDRAISKLDIIKFFTQLAWEAKLIPTKQYSEFSIKLEEIGRQLGGWKKGMQTKKLSQLRREKNISFREDTVTNIPVVRVLDRVSVDVPAIIVPFRVHSPQKTALFIHIAILITIS